MADAATKELLTSAGLEKLIPLFAKEEIGLRAAQLLTDADLELLGVRLGTRVIIRDTIARLQEQNMNAAAPNPLLSAKVPNLSSVAPKVSSPSPPNSISSPISNNGLALASAAPPASSVRGTPAVRTSPISSSSASGSKSF